MLCCCSADAEKHASHGRRNAWRNAGESLQTHTRETPPCTGSSMGQWVQSLGVWSLRPQCSPQRGAPHSQHCHQQQFSCSSILYVHTGELTSKCLHLATLLVRLAGEGGLLRFLRVEPLSVCLAPAAALCIIQAMRVMNKRMNLPNMQKVLMEFEKQNERMDMTSEMMGDAIDDAMEVRGGGDTGGHCSQPGCQHRLGDTQPDVHTCPCF